ncbi:unnamed protein product, partial [Medioppia subpectinata]
ATHVLIRGLNVLKLSLNEQNCQIDGYYDVRNKVIFLHLTSILDSLAMTHICKDIEKDIYEKGFLQVWPDLQTNLCKALLILFHLSHIVVVVNPSPHFDLNQINMFRILDSTRQKLQPIITECLQTLSSLPADWVQSGRLCSPRALFVFESYGKNQFITREKLRNAERQLEDQIYRILRKTRLITNISANSLFAVSAHHEYVFISAKDPTIRDSGDYLMNRLIQYCKTDRQSNSSSDEENDCEWDSFHTFLWTHIGIAHSKGFDDNIGRHAAPPIFELPSAKEFFQTALKLKELLFGSTNGENASLKTILNSLHSSLDIDTRFSESRCAKVLPIAMSIYQDALPSHYTRDFHEHKLAHALQHFTLQARGSAVYDFGQQLKLECDNYWQNGRQMCEVLSLTNNHCINPIHRLKSDDDNSNDNSDSDTESDSKQRLPSMKHMSGAKLICACDCGRRQANREDPFTVKAANHDFYAMLKKKCSCGHLERILFPVFEPSSDYIEPVARPQPLPRSPVHSKAASSQFDPSLTPAELAFESQPDAGVSSFTNLSQQVSADLNTDLLLDEFNKVSVKEDDKVEDKVEDRADDNKAAVETVLSDQQKEIDPQLELRSEQLVKDLVDDDESHTSSSEVYTDDDEEEEEEEDGDEAIDRENDIELVIRESESPHFGQLLHQSSTTEYLPGMLHTMSPPGLLPRFNSWSLVCLGPSSLYSHNIGLQEQPGFISGANFLLPWDVTVKLEHSGHLPPLWEGKRPPGIKNKKTFKDGTQFTVKVFIGVEYECHRGHRFIASGPDSVLKASMGIVKESANRVASNDMPLYFPCVCNRQGKPNTLAQLMRVHIVTPKAPVNVTLNPRVQPSPMPCLIFYPGNTEPIRLSQSTYWVLRLPMIYEAECGPFPTPKDQLPLKAVGGGVGGGVGGSGVAGGALKGSRLLKGTYGIADYISKPKNH